MNIRDVIALKFSRILQISGCYKNSMWVGSKTGAFIFQFSEVLGSIL